MKLSIIISTVVIFVLFFSCSKEHQLPHVISQTVGTYNTTEICNTDSEGILVHSDTTHNVPLTISSSGDSLIIFGAAYYFNGNLSTKQYSFECVFNFLSATAGSAISIDSTLHHFDFNYGNCTDLTCDYETRCDYYWSK
jgi:hypothetical protein